MSIVSKALDVPTYEDATDFIAKKLESTDWSKKTLPEIIDEAVFPHLGNSNEGKVRYAAHLTNQLLLSWCGLRHYDDPLHAGNRTVLTPGEILKQIYNDSLNEKLELAHLFMNDYYLQSRLPWAEEDSSDSSDNE